MGKIKEPVLINTTRGVYTRREEINLFDDYIDHYDLTIPVGKLAEIVASIQVDHPNCNVELDRNVELDYGERGFIVTCVTPRLESDESYEKRVIENRAKYDLAMLTYRKEVDAAEARLLAYDAKVDGYDAVVLQLGSLSL
jgi:hypothetical protein